MTYLYLIILISIFILIVNKSIYKVKNYNIGLYILIIYIFVALNSVIIVNRDIAFFDQLKIWPFLLLSFSILIILFPFLKVNNFTPNNFTIMNVNFFVVISYIYIIASFLTISIYLPESLKIVTEGNWTENIMSSYQGEKPQLYNNFLEFMSINIVSYFKLLAITIFFFFLKFNCNPKTRNLLFLSLISSSLIMAIYISSRGAVFNLMLIIVAFMIIFFFSKKEKTKSEKKFILQLTFVGALFLWYAISVTIDRFANNLSSKFSSMDSLVYYFGHSPIIFNSAITQVDQHSYGYFLFGRLFELLGFEDKYLNFNIVNFWDTNFFTYVGSIFIDFGALGVILFSLLLSFFAFIILNRQFYTISTTYLVFIFISFLIEGAFVIGRSYSILMFGQLTIFVIIFLVERIKLKRGIN